MKLMDLISNFTDHINDNLNMPMPLKMGYLSEGESFVVYPTPGSRVVREFYDGTKERELNYDLAMQSKDQQALQAALWIAQSDLENLAELPSKNGSYDFDEIIIGDKPFINQIDDQGWFVFMLRITIKVTTYKKESV